MNWPKRVGTVFFAALMLVLPEVILAQAGGGPVNVSEGVFSALHGAPKLPPSVRKNALKKKNKKKNKGGKKHIKKNKPRLKMQPQKKKESKAKKYSIGLKGALLPINDMNVKQIAGGGAYKDADYDFGVIFGWGVQFQYRLFKDISLLGEFMYFYPSVDDTDGHDDISKASGLTDKKAFLETDGLLNIGVGVRYNVLGGEHTTDRVYLKGHFGFADYITHNDARIDKGDRIGIYFNALVGVEHMFSRMFTVFADTGYLFNRFTNPSKGEEEATLQAWTINAGFLFHWGK